VSTTEELIAEAKKIRHYFLQQKHSRKRTLMSKSIHRRLRFDDVRFFEIGEILTKRGCDMDKIRAEIESIEAEYATKTESLF